MKKATEIITIKHNTGFRNIVIVFSVYIIISILPLRDFFHSGFPLTHDGQDHIARIANFYQNLSEGVLIPRWAGNLNWGYGHPVLMFLYPMPSYMASFFHALNFSLIDSVKLVFIATYVFSGLAMYLWVREIFGEYPGLIAGLLYMVAPYRFVDLYVRGAIGEHVAFVFPPLILFFLLRLGNSRSYRYFLGTTFSLAGLVLSHNALSLMFLPIIIIYALFLLLQAKNKYLLLINFLLALCLGFGLSAFFWIPAFFEGKYTLRDIVTSKDYSSRFVQISDFFSLAWNYGGSSLLSKQVGIVHWLLAICSVPVIYLFRKREKLKNVLLVGSLTIFLISLYIMTPYAKLLWDTVSTLQKFQFPWRFLSVTVFAVSVIGGFVIYAVPRRYQLSVSICVIVLLLLENSGYWHAKGYLDKPEAFYTRAYYGTTDTGESSPIWSVRFMEKRPKVHMEVLEGQATIKENERKMTKRVYVVHTKTKTRLRENTLYFPGWNVLVDGKSVPVEFQDPLSRGLITFFVERGEHAIEVYFGETKLRMIANALTSLSIFSLVMFAIVSKYIKRR